MAVLASLIALRKSLLSQLVTDIPRGCSITKTPNAPVSQGNNVTLIVNCTGGNTEGELVTVTVTANTPAFFLPGSLTVSARANAPEESP